MRQSRSIKSKNVVGISTKISIEMDSDIFDEASKLNISMAQFIRDAIAEYIKRIRTDDSETPWEASEIIERES